MKALNFVENGKYAPTGFKNKYYRYNGIAKDAFYQKNIAKGKRIEFYVLLYFHVIEFYGQAKNCKKEYMFSNKGIQNYFSQFYYNHVDITTIKRGWATLERLELIKRDSFTGFRKVTLNEEVAYQLMNIYEVKNDEFISSYANSLATKHVNDASIPNECQLEMIKKLEEIYSKQLRKIVSKRLLSYVEKAKEKYLHYKESGVAKGKYSDQNEMVAYFIHEVTSKYFNVSEFFNKFLPDNLRDKQEVIDDYLIKQLPKEVRSLSKEEIVRIKTMSIPKARKLVGKVIGWKVVPDLRELAVSANILLNDDGQIIGYNYFKARFGVNLF